MERLVRLGPLIAALAVAAIPLAQHGQRVRAESAGASFLQQLAASQQEFRRRQSGRGFTASLDSLTAVCPGEPSPPLPVDAVRLIGASGFEVLLRAAENAQPDGTDCHGRPLVSDFYAALQPASVEAAPRQALATTGLGGRIFVFFDGVAPREKDMAAGGLATPFESLGTFTIP